MVCDNSNCIDLPGTLLWAVEMDNGNCIDLPDTLLWPAEMDNGNAIACPTHFYGPQKWTTATQLLARHAFMARGKLIPGNYIMCREIIRFYGPRKWITTKQLHSWHALWAAEMGNINKN